jgi:hypothetical protein
MTRIVRARLGVADLPEELGRLVAEKAEGNALFAEEIVSFLLERGVVRQTAEGLVYDAGKAASGLPASVQTLLTARASTGWTTATAPCCRPPRCVRLSLDGRQQEPGRLLAR